MILDNILESMGSSIGTQDDKSFIENLEPIVESYIPDNVGGIAMIHNEALEDQFTIDEAVMFCEQVALIHSIKGNEEASETLSEGIIADYFAKAVEGFKKMYQKVKGWFEQLIKNIKVSIGDVTKTIEKYKDDLNKDFKEYTYSGHKWGSNDISYLNSGADKILASISSRIKGINIDKIQADAAKPIEKGGVIDKHVQNVNSTVKGMQRASTDNMIYGLMNSGSYDTQNSTSMNDAKSTITKKVKGEESASEIKNFAATPLNTMLDFIKSFDKNSVLKEAKDKVDRNYNKVIKEAKDVQSQVVSAERRASGPNKTAINNKTVSLKGHIGELGNAVAAYDKLMAVHIDLEKEKFKEFRQAVIGAIRYNPVKK